jgi:hypothetical protein
MTKQSSDISYAYAQLGLAPGATLSEIREVLIHARAYRFFTKERVEHVRRFVDFFAARETLGGFEYSYIEIKKLYHLKAMELHPDRNKGNKASEDQLKTINAAYNIIENIHRQSKNYFKQNERQRLDLERHFREETERERPPRRRQTPEPPLPPTEDPAAARPRQAGSKKYMAASIPRSIRTTRLPYLPLNTIIGCTFTKKENDINYVFDIIMLPEDQFIRAKSYLGSPAIMSADLQYGKFSPPYIPRDTKEVIIPPDELDPEKYARNYFKKAFKI